MSKLRNVYIEIGVRGLFLLQDEKKVATIARLNLLFLVFSLYESHAHAYDGAKYGKLCATILTELSGDLGSLFASVAGIGAVVATAMGGMKMAWSLVIVSLGAYLLATYQELWFDKCAGGN